MQVDIEDKGADIIHTYAVLEYNTRTGKTDQFFVHTAVQEDNETNAGSVKCDSIEDVIEIAKWAVHKKPWIEVQARVPLYSYHGRVRVLFQENNATKHITFTVKSPYDVATKTKHVDPSKIIGIIETFADRIRMYTPINVEEQIRAWSE